MQYELTKKRRISIKNQTESNKEIKQNERRQEKENIIDEDIDVGRFCELATSDKTYVNGLNLHEIKNEFLLDSKGDFESNGIKLIGPIEHKTNIRFKSMDYFEAYINAIDYDHDSEDVIFTGYFYKLITPQFKRVNRSQYGKGKIFVHDVVEYIGNSCYIPTGCNCFIKRFKYFTNKDYTEKFLTFIRTEQRRSNAMLAARIQPFCRKNNIIIGCSD